MIILDHNIPEDQAQQLRRQRIHFRQIGFEIGRPEWDNLHKNLLRQGIGVRVIFKIVLKKSL